MCVTIAGIDKSQQLVGRAFLGFGILGRWGDFNAGPRLPEVIHFRFISVGSAAGAAYRDCRAGFADNAQLVDNRQSLTISPTIIWPLTAKSANNCIRHVSARGARGFSLISVDGAHLQEKTLNGTEAHGAVHFHN